MFLATVAALCACGGDAERGPGADATRDATAPPGDGRDDDLADLGTETAEEAHDSDDGDGDGDDSEAPDGDDGADADADVSPDPCRASAPTSASLVVSGRFAEVVGLPPGAGLLPRGVRVYLPAGFDASAAARYPVLYMHDGQNLFDPSATPFGEWGVDEVLDDLTARGVVPATFVVAIDNTSERFGDYTPTVDAREGGGNAEAYGAWLVDVLKPAIDQLLPTRCEREHTAVAGSSLGGLVSLWLGTRWPSVFGRVAAVSPSLWWDDERLLRALEAGGASAMPWPTRLWIDMGTGESDTSPHALDEGVAAARRAFEAARGAGLAYGSALGYLEAIGARHNEQAWRQRLPTIFGFLLSDAGFAAFGVTPSVALRPSGDGLYLDGRPAVLVTAELVAGDGARAPRMTLPRAALAAEGAAALDADGVLRASEAAGEVTLRADAAPFFAGLAAAGVTAPAPATRTLPVHARGLAPVTFEAQLPAETPADATVHVSGDIAALGAWDPAALACARPSARLARCPEVAVPIGPGFHYRYTLGDDARHEAGLGGAPAAPRVSGPVPSEGLVRVDLVYGWLGL